jgi:AcrR family transcriptional regulator
LFANDCWHSVALSAHRVNKRWPTLVGMTFSPRSEQTRAAILAAARRRFAADGFERTTIRAIAADAGIDPSMVMRYYGSKDGLFAAAADIELRLPDLATVPREKLGETLVRHWVERWEGGLSDELLVVLLRSAMTNEHAAAQLRAVFGAQVGQALAAVVEDPAEAPARAGLVATQMLGLALCRHVVRLPPVVGLDADTLIASVGATVQRYLTAPLARRAPERADRTPTQE